MRSRAQIIGWGMLMLGVVVIFAFISNPFHTKVPNLPSKDLINKNHPIHQPDQVVKPSQPVVEQLSLPILVRGENEWISLDQLAEAVGGKVFFDSMEGTVKAELLGKTVGLLREAPMLEVNGLFLPTGQKPLLINESSDVFIRLDALELYKTLGLSIEKNNDEAKISWDPSIAALKPTTPDAVLETNEPSRLIDYLSFLTPPIANAQVSTRDSHLPGALRDYRNGYHEGIDWYYDQEGNRVDLTTPVLAQADGVVVRADLNYVEFTDEGREKVLNLSKSLSHTPQYILDQLRGRSVWVQYERGVLVRYAHLSSVREGLDIGMKVKRGEIIGLVGNSGTSSSVKQNHEDLHLHMDILIYGRLFWDNLNQQDIRSVLEGVFPVNLRKD
jgi:murein DD-endopeptidase MepM/ murein hydrolase activator NlpD